MRLERFLFVRTDRLGETLLTLPAISALKRILPKAHLTFLAHPDLVSLLARLPGIDAAIPYPPGARTGWIVRAVRTAGWLRSQRYHAALVANPMKELHLAVWLAGIPRRVGYDRKWGSLLTDRLSEEKALGERHEVEYNLDLVRTLGIPASLVPLRVPAFEAEQALVFQQLSQQGVKSAEPFLAVHPWSSNPIKLWPMDRYTALVRALLERFGCQVVLIGGREFQEPAARHFPPAPRLANVVGQLRLEELTGLLQRARALVSNDSGPMHLAALVGTPTVALFGTPDPATGPKRWGPWGDGHTVIWKSSMADIDLEDVLTALERRVGSRR